MVIDFCLNRVLKVVYLAWSFTLNMIFLGIWSPLATYLSHRWSNRIVIAIGGFLFSLGSLTCAFTTRAWQAVLLYGGIAGVGSAFLYTPLFSLLPRYFDKHVTLACSIAGASIHLGPVAGAPVSQVIMDRFGMEGIATVYGVGGIIIIFSAIFLRPSSRFTNKTRDGGDEKSELKKFLTMFTFFKTHPRVIVWISVVVVAYALFSTASVHLVSNVSLWRLFDRSSIQCYLLFRFGMLSARCKLAAKRRAFF